LPEQPEQYRALPQALRFALAIGGITVCLWGFLNTWRSGASRLLTFHGRRAGLIVQSDNAVKLTPDDPEAHSGRAFVLLNGSGPAAALPEYELAVALRPRDYFLWLELGRARDIADDEEGAIQALRQAVNLAPDYAAPRWQFGNVLFRAGRVDEAFIEMRRAALSDPALLPNLIDLAWRASGGDPAIVEQVLRPLSASWMIACAKYFVKQGKVSEALKLFRAAGGLSAEERESLLKELLAMRLYHEAYEVWANLSGPNQPEVRRDDALINDGGFEGKLLRGDPGFVWQPAADAKTLRISLDQQGPRSGTQSLRIDFNGETNPNQAILTQLILVEPNTRYHLSFAALTEEIVSGGLPLVEVSEAVGSENRPLGQSQTLPQNSGVWQKYEFDFMTESTTNAIQLSLRRQNCSSGPCPIFGRVWLDDFVLEKR